MNLRKVNEEVFVALDPIVRIRAEEIAFLKHQAISNPRKRARICAHKANEDALHEMVIAIASSSYIRPHKHLGKSESFHIIEGEVDVVVFDETGDIRDIIQMGEVVSGRSFFYRLAESAFHTLLIRTDFLVVHEVTNGPFLPEQTVLASFAPPEHGGEDVKAFLLQVERRVAALLRARRG